jgi:molybdate transport system substrate-binding protein
MSKTLMFAITLVFALPASLLAQVRPAQVTVITSGGFSASYEELLPQFEKSTGITVTTRCGENLRAMDPTQSTAANTCTN